MHQVVTYSINMNGRMYDPLTSSFLSPDNYIQDPTTQQSFNRYAYCMYNPLKYVDPSGKRCVGGIISGYLLEQAYRELMIMRYNNYLEIMEPTWERMNWLINSIYSVGDSSAGALSNNNHGGSGNHGTPGGDGYGNITCEAHQQFNESQRDNVDVPHGKCVFGSLGSTCDIWNGALTTQQWIDSANASGIDIETLCNTENLQDFIKSNDYVCEEIYMYQICDAMNEGYVVNAWCTLNGDIVDYYNLNGTSHFVNISDCIMYDNGDIGIGFNDFRSNTFMTPYESNINPPNNAFNFSTYTDYHGFQIINSIRFFMIKPNWP